MRTARTAGWLAGALAAGAALAGLGLLAPPLNLLTHELTQGFTLVAGVAWLVAAWALARRHGGPALWLSVAGAQLSGAGALAVHLLVDGPILGCHTHTGALFFAMTWVPTGLLVAVLGTLAGVAGWSWRRLALGAGLGLAALVAHDLIQELRGLRVVDPLLGSPMFLNQRASLQMSGAEGAQRAWLLAVAVAAWPVGRWRSERTPALVAGALVLAATLLGGSHLGLGWGRASLEAHLDGVVETEHFTVRFDRSGDAALYAQLVATEAEFHRLDLARDWDLPDSARVELRLHDDRVAMRRVTGMTAAHAGPGWVDLPLNRALSSTLRHELVHALHLQIWPHPLAILNRGILEGTAMAWEHDQVRLPAAHQDQAASLRNGDLPAAPDFMSLLGFWTGEERAAYQASGSFMGWLVLEYGAEAFLRLQHTMDWEEVYGADLTELDTRWRAFLEGVPVDVEARARARDLFDRDLHPGYLDRTCPKVGAALREAEDLARERQEWGDHAGAAALYLQLFDDTDKPRWARLAVASSALAGDLDGAEAILARAWSLELAEDQEAGLAEEELRLRLAQGAWDAVPPLLSRLDEYQDTERWTALAPLLADPALRTELSRLLLAETRTQRIVSLIRLEATHPEVAAIRDLYLRDGVALSVGYRSLGLSEPTRAEVDRVLDLVASTPSACDPLDQTLADLGWVAARLGERRLATRAAQIMQAHCTTATALVGADRILRHLAWQSAPPAPEDER